MSQINIHWSTLYNKNINNYESELLFKQTLTKFKDNTPVDEFYKKYIIKKIKDYLKKNDDFKDIKMNTIKYYDMFLNNNDVLLIFSNHLTKNNLQTIKIDNINVELNTNSFNIIIKVNTNYLTDTYPEININNNDSNKINELDDNNVDELNDSSEEEEEEDEEDDEEEEYEEPEEDEDETIIDDENIIDDSEFSDEEEEEKIKKKSNKKKYNEPKPLLTLEKSVNKKNKINQITILKLEDEITTKNKDTYKIRLKVIEELNNINSKMKYNLDPYILEKNIYNYTIRKSIDKYISCDWNNKSFRVIYLDKVKSIFSNLDNNYGVVNKDIGKLIKKGKITSENIVDLDYVKLYPKNWEYLNDEKKKREEMIKNKVFAITTNMFTCYKCKKNQCSYFELQTRSADEPSTTFINCLNCGNKWKQN